MDLSLQNGPLQRGPLQKGLQELSRYVIGLRVPLLLAAMLVPRHHFHEPSRSPQERNPRQDVRFSTPAGMSARFPLISPYAFFDGTEVQRQRRTVDGG